MSNFGSRKAFLMNNKEKDKNYYNGPQSLSPLPLHVASAVIKPLDGNNIRSVALVTMEKQANQQIHMLKRQAELIMQQVKEIEERVQLSVQIYKADINFDPTVGNIYHLYEKGERRFMSMIGPGEWDIVDKGFSFIASVELNPDKTWEVLSLSTDYSRSDM